MPELDELINEIVAFRDQRDWEQFHNAKDLALALSIEAAELNELFLWKNAADADAARIQEELADVLSFAFLLAHQQRLSIPDIIRKKLHQNAEKYPVDKAKGTAKKYNEF